MRIKKSALILLFSITKFTALYSSIGTQNYYALHPAAADKDYVAKIQDSLFFGIVSDDLKVTERALYLHGHPDQLFQKALEYNSQHRGCPEKRFVGTHMTPFLLACQLGRAYHVQLMVRQKGAELVNKTDEYGNTPLMYAAQGLNDNFELNLTTIKFLLGKKADIRRKNNLGANVFSYAQWLSSSDEITRFMELLPQEDKN